MGIKFGEINANQILENEFRIGILEKVMDLFVQKNIVANNITKEELVDIKREVVENLKRKYPNSGLELKI